jgi:VWFA-related protein
VRVATVAVLLGVAAAVAAPPEPAPSVRFPVAGDVVHLTVTVTDRRGRAVEDLQAADFVVYEDGNPVPITAFRPPARRTAQPSGDPAAPPSAPGDNVQRETDAATFVVYLDNWNLTPPDRARALPALRAFLMDQLGRGNARAAVLSASDRIRPLSALTSSPGEVAAALDTAAGEPTHRHTTLSDARQAIETVRALLETGIADCSDLAALQAPIRAHAQARLGDLQRSAAALEVLVQALGTVPGRKALLHLSDGLEQRPAIDLFHQLGDICPGAMQREFSAVIAPMHDYDLSRRFQALAAHANAARVTLHMLDASGVTGLPGTDLAERDRGFAPSSSTNRIREQNLRAGSAMLARETGGTAVFNANDLQKPLHEIAGQIGASYAVGFTPHHEPEARAHRLRVEVRRKGIAARHAASYHHAPRADRHGARVLVALLMGLEEDTLGASLSIEEVPPSAGGPDTSRAIGVRIGIPLDRLAAAGRSAKEERRVRVAMAIWRAGERGRPRRVEVREEVMNIPLAVPTAAPSPPPRHEIVVRVPVTGEETELGVGVHAEDSALATYRRLQLRPD